MLVSFPEHSTLLIHMGPEPDPNAPLVVALSAPVKPSILCTEIRAILAATHASNYNTSIGHTLPLLLATPSTSWCPSTWLNVKSIGS